VGVSPDPGALLLLATALALYGRAVRVLARRGVTVGRGQQAAWYGGVALVAVGLLSPVDALGEELLTAHMAQHLLIADLAAPLLLTGLRWPVLVFILPRPVLVPLARRRRLRRAFAVLRQPLVAIPVFIVVLYGWHLRFMFEAALASPIVHAIQHQSFVLAAVLVWWPVLEPGRRRMPGELWKIGYILSARMAGMMLGMAFIVMRTPVYAGAYGDAAREHGLTPLGDQQTAGGIMLSLDILVMIFALSFLFWRAAQDHDRAEAAASDRAKAPAAGRAEAAPADGAAPLIRVP
jgi:putative membrane protein